MQTQTHFPIVRGQARIFRQARELPSGVSAHTIARRPDPRRVLMVNPSTFEVRFEKNHLMVGNVGKADHALAMRQWEDLHAVYQRTGVDLTVLEGAPDLEDMVFTANSSFVATGVTGPVAVMPRMIAHNRSGETPYFARWFAEQGYPVHEVPQLVPRFEGQADAIKLMGGNLVFGAHGQRTDASVHAYLSQLTGAAVLIMELANPILYHLDTALSPLDETHALICPSAFSKDSLELLQAIFGDGLLIADEEESVTSLACNARSFVAPDGQRYVLIDSHCPKTIKTLEKAGFTVIPLDTSEYLKSGGSVSCMTMLVYGLEDGRDPG